MVGQFVKFDADERSDGFNSGGLAFAPTSAKISDDRFALLNGRVCVARVEFAPNERVSDGVRCAAGNRRQDPPVAAHRLEDVDFFIRLLAWREPRRTQYDERLA